MLRLTPMSLNEYRACRTQEGDEIERARRFFVESWQGLAGANGDGRCQGWRRTCDRDVARTLFGVVDNLHRVAERLRGVAIDNLDWREVLKRYDGPRTLFYLDPPYLPQTRNRSKPSDGYGANDLTAAEHPELLQALQTLQGAAVISGYPSELYEEHLGNWNKATTTTCGLQRSKSTEVLWSNRPWPGQQSLAGMCEP